MVNKIISSGVVEEIVDNLNVPDTYKEDLIQEIYLILLEYDQDKLNNIPEKEIKYFVSRIIINNWNSKTSPFYTKYRKYYEYTDDTIDPISTEGSDE